MNGRSLVALMVVAELAALLPLAAFPALVPQFAELWGLSATQSGWIAGIYYLGYMAAVPVLMGLTDRVDARRVMLCGALVSAAGSFGFALFAGGFWSALAWRALDGMGLAGIYMPGLKALTDRLSGMNQSRAVTAYTAFYSVGVSASFLLAGAAFDLFGWRAAFAAAGLGPLVTLAVAASLRPVPAAGSARRLFDFRPVFANRAAMGYMLAYGAHGFELLALRAWVTAFFAFVLLQQPGGWLASATAVAALTTVLGLPASIIGNELALRFGRQRFLIWEMTLSAALAGIVALASGQGFWLLLGLVCLYSLFVSADSGALTAGTVAAARPEHQGATMALHSVLGFGGSALGPLCVGLAIDGFGGPDAAAGWSAGFVAMGLGVLLGPLALVWLRR